MTPEEQRKLEEQQIKDRFSELQNKLVGLKEEIKREADINKKQEREKEVAQLEKEAEELELIINDLESLQQEALDSLKDRLEDYAKAVDNFKGEIADLLNDITEVPTTYDLLKNSATIKGFEGDPEHPGLLKIIENNPNEFKDIPGNTAEAKLEYIFSAIRRGVVLYMKNKLGNSPDYDKVINNTIAPAIEWNLINLLREQGNNANKGMLEGLNNISWKNLEKLLTGTAGFSLTANESYKKFSGWMNAIDYLSMHNGVLKNPEKSKVLTNPIEFQKYLDNQCFLSNTFSPYEKISGNIFEVNEDETYNFGISNTEKEVILKQIGEVKVVNNPTTTSLIAKLVDKPEKFLEATSGWKDSANLLLDGIQAINSVTSVFGLPGIDIMWESSKLPQERHRLYKVLDFVFKLIGVSGGLEGTIRRRRLDKLNLTDEKNDNITAIFKEYQNKVGKGSDISITDKNSCDLALKEFELTDLNKASSTTRGDHLRDMISENINLDLISPVVVKQTLGESYVKEEEVEINGRKQKREVVNISKFTDDDKKQLAHTHIENMRNYFSSNFDNLQEFYKDIHNTDDIALCMTTSLYADKEDVVEGVKARVFLPENYYTPENTGAAS